VHGFVTSLVATPHAVWYVGGLSRISGLAHVAGRLTTAEQVTASGLGHYNLSPGTGGLAYDARSIWALGSQERLLRIDATTGNVVRRYTYRDYDQARSGSLEFLTAADGWLWFLDNGNPLSSVLRISEATGRPAGGVPILPGSCGQSPCSLIFSTPGSIWVPTAQLLIRIDPSALRPGAPANLLDADSPTTWLIGRRGMTGLSHCPPLGPFAAPPPMAPLPSGPRRACTGGT
jgi:hypothetical protein